MRPVPICSGRIALRRAFLTLLIFAAGVAGVQAQEQAPPIDLSQFNIGVFADAGYSASRRHGEKQGFRLGAIDLYGTGQISDRWSALIELVFENDQNELVTDLERLQVSYDYSDALRVSAGRIHNPLIRWNVAQHHGAFIQTPIDKPAITRWEDQPGLWPVHFVGVAASGRVLGSSPFPLDYDVALGNGRGDNLDEIQVGGDKNHSKAVILALGTSPAALVGLEVFATMYFDDIPDPAQTLRERDLTLSTVYEHAGTELRAEWATMRHTGLVDRHRYETNGWYALLSQRLPGRFANFRPYLMLDRLAPADGEPFLQGTADEHSWVAGLRWDLSSRSAVKVDYRVENAAGVRDRSLAAQIAVSLR